MHHHVKYWVHGFGSIRAKDDDHARLDITHHSSLSNDEVQKIEDEANDMIKKNLSSKSIIMIEEQQNKSTDLEFTREVLFQ